MISRSKSWLLLTAITLLVVACSEQESSPAMPSATQAGSGTSSSDTPKGLDYAFYKESVEPIFIRYRGGFVGSDTACVACHTVQAMLLWA